MNSSGLLDTQDRRKHKSNASEIGQASGRFRALERKEGKGLTSQPEPNDLCLHLLTPKGRKNKTGQCREEEGKRGNGRTMFGKKLFAAGRFFSVM